MKTRLRICISLLLAVLFVLTATLSASAATAAEAAEANIADGVEIDGEDSVNEAYAVIHNLEFFAIYKARFSADGETEEDVYYIACRGLDFEELNMTKPRSLATAIRAILSDESNPYVTAVTEAVCNYVAPGSKLVFTGHSLGGMVIQQLIANKKLKGNYEILSATALGSPYIVTRYAKEGSLVRFADKRDPVPFLSIALLANPYIGKVLTADCGASLLDVHFDCYSGENVGNVWGDYDILGNCGDEAVAYVDLTGLVFAPEK